MKKFFAIILAIAMLSAFMVVSSAETTHEEVYLIDFDGNIIETRIYQSHIFMAQFLMQTEQEYPLYVYRL